MKKRVLLVDDETRFTRLLKLNLEQTGRYEVREENEGLQAVRTAQEFKPDIILLDIIMPDANGSEIAVQIKNNEKLKNVPIVFITAILSREEVAPSDNCLIGGNRFIAKPVTMEEVLSCLEQVEGNK